MRTFWAVAVLLVACRGSADGPDGAVVTPKAQAVDSAEDEPEAPPDAQADAGRAATLRDLDGGPAPLAKLGGIRLCKIHSAWVLPADFTAMTTPEGVVARHGEELLAIAFPAAAEDAFARASAAFVEGQVAWDAPSMNRIDAWHAEATTHGHANGLVIATRTIYAGVDPKTGKGRPGNTFDIVWIAIAPTEARADQLLADAREHAKSFVDHACECGYDCEKRR